MAQKRRVPYIASYLELVGQCGVSLITITDYILTPFPSTPLGNIATDSVSSKKYYHFLRCGSSILTFESALQTRPTISIIAEEAHQMKLRLSTIVEKVADIVTFRRHRLGKHSGTILLTDKLIETLPEVLL